MRDSQFYMLSLMCLLSSLYTYLIFLLQGTSREGTENKKLDKDAVFPYIYGCKFCILHFPRLSISDFDLLLVGLLGVAT